MLGSETALKIVIDAENRAKAVLADVQSDLKGFNKSFEDTAKGFKQFGAGITAVGVGLGGLLVATGLTAARVEVLDTVLESIGKVSGISKDKLKEQEEVIKKLGITTKEAREILILFMQGQLDVADASKISRVAQDLAVIAGVNSSEAAKTLTEAIISQHPMLLRNFGIVQNLNDVYLTYGKELDIVSENVDKNGKVSNIWVRELTDVEKRQAMLNMILKEGAKVTGTYEAAMTNAGKQLTSLPRYIEEAKLAFGQAFIPVIGLAVEKLTELLKWFAALSPETQKMITYVTMGAAAFTLILGPILLLIGFLPTIAAGFVILTGTVGAVMVAITAIIAVLGLLVYTGWYLYKNWDEIIIGYKIIWEEFKNKVEKIVNSIIGFLKAWWDEIVRIFTEIGYFLLGVVLLWAAYLRPVWEPLVEATTIAFSWLQIQIQTISNFILGVFNKLRELLTPIWKGISDTIKAVWDSIKTYFSDTWEGIKIIFSEAIDWLMRKIQPFLDAFNRVREGVSWLAAETGATVKGAIETLKDIGKAGVIPFQHGGIVPGPIGAPVPALVHGGETIIPRGKGLGNIYLTITGNTFMSDEEAAEKIGDRIIKILRTQNRFIY